MKRLRKRWQRWAAYALLPVGLYAGICFGLAGIYLSPARSVPVLPEGFSEVKIGRAPAWVSDGLPLRSGGTVFVFAHGYGGDRGHWKDVARDLRKQGFDSVIPAMPGQDASPVKQVGFGTTEAELLAQCFRWVRDRRPGCKIVVVGVSMGGAAAWLASSLDPSIDGVVSESAYARFSPAMDYWLDRAAPAGHIFLRPVVWIARAKAGIEPDSIRPEDAAAKWRGRPALVIHAGEDRLIEPWHGRRLSEAAGCELWMVPKAAHACCADVLHGRYAERLASFAKGIGERRLK
jgi:uncharacterized protein